MQTAFPKPATTYDQQLKRLKQRGMVIDDDDTAKHYLQHLNYYRLAAYWLPFEEDHSSHQFKQGTRFSDVLDLYIFDRELRLLILDAIERIEVSVRAQWAYHLAHHHGSHAHLDNKLFDGRFWQSNLDKLTDEVKRSDEIFIRHHRNTYVELLPPVWVVCEVMSLGLLSRWFNSLKPSATRRAIANVYGVDEKVLQSWLHHLSLVRNICAHHARLWNRDFTIIPNAPRSKPSHLSNQFITGSRKIYNTLLILLHGMDTIAQQHHWRIRLKQLIEKHGIPVSDMDFPSDWLQRSIWRETA